MLRFSRHQQFRATTTLFGSTVWMAPCAKSFNKEKFIMEDNVNPSFFEQPSGADVSTIVVSAQTVNELFLQSWKLKAWKNSRNGKNATLGSGKPTSGGETNSPLTLIRRGTSLGSIDLNSARELGINVLSTPGVNSPHVAKFVIDNLKIVDAKETASTPSAAPKVVVFGAGSVGKFIIKQLNDMGIKPLVVDPIPASLEGLTPESATIAPVGMTPGDALAFNGGATHVAVCCATSAEKPVFDEATIEAAKLEGRRVNIVSVARPEGFSLGAILRLPETVDLRFDYGPTVLAPMQEMLQKAEATGNKAKCNISWSSMAMGSEACKEDMDNAVLQLL